MTPQERQQKPPQFYMHLVYTFTSWIFFTFFFREIPSLMSLSLEFQEALPTTSLHKEILKPTAMELADLDSHHLCPR